MKKTECYTATFVRRVHIPTFELLICHQLSVLQYFDTRIKKRCCLIPVWKYFEMIIILLQYILYFKRNQHSWRLWYDGPYIFKWWEYLTILIAYCQICQTFSFTYIVFILNLLKITNLTGYIWKQYDRIVGVAVLRFWSCMLSKIKRTSMSYVQ